MGQWEREDYPSNIKIGDDNQIWLHSYEAVGIQEDIFRRLGHHRCWGAGISTFFLSTVS